MWPDFTCLNTKSFFQKLERFRSFAKYKIANKVLPSLVGDQALVKEVCSMSCICIITMAAGRYCYHHKMLGTLTCFVRGSTHCTADILFDLFVVHPTSKWIVHHMRSSWIQTCKTGGQSYSANSPYCLARYYPKVSLCSLVYLKWTIFGLFFGYFQSLSKEWNKFIQYPVGWLELMTFRLWVSSINH